MGSALLWEKLLLEDQSFLGAVWLFGHNLFPFSLNLFTVPLVGIEGVERIMES